MRSASAVISVKIVVPRPSRRAAAWLMQLPAGECDSTIMPGRPRPRSRPPAVLVDQRRLGVGDRGMRGEVVDDELPEVLGVGGGHPDEVVGHARRGGRPSARRAARARRSVNASICSRAWTARRTAMSACSGRPRAARSTSAWKPRITPRSRSERSRASAVDGATPTRSARRWLVIRASAATSSSIARSIGVNGRLWMIRHRVESVAGFAKYIR